MGRQVKTGVRKGAGVKPGYQWTIHYLNWARREAMEFLSEPQYQHIVDQIKQLARETDPTHSQTCSIDAIDDYFELRDKGGLLGKINVRVFFGIKKQPEHTIVVLGCIKKENNGATPLGDRIRMQRRWRKYRHGEYEVADGNAS